MRSYRAAVDEPVTLMERGRSVYVTTAVDAFVGTEREAIGRVGGFCLSGAGAV